MFSAVCQNAFLALAKWTGVDHKRRGKEKPVQLSAIRAGNHIPILLSHLDRSRNELILLKPGQTGAARLIVLAQALKDARCPGQVATFELDP